MLWTDFGFFTKCLKCVEFRKYLAQSLPWYKRASSLRARFHMHTTQILFTTVYAELTLVCVAHITKSREFRGDVARLVNAIDLELLRRCQSLFVVRHV